LGERAANERGLPGDEKRKGDRTKSKKQKEDQKRKKGKEGPDFWGRDLKGGSNGARGWWVWQGAQGGGANGSAEQKAGWRTAPLPKGPLAEENESE